MGMTKLLSLLLALSLTLTGCMSLGGGARSETIIIPDTGEPSQTAGGNASYDVKTIYRIMEQGKEYGIPLGWLDHDALLSLFMEQPREPSLDRVDFPYESHLKWRTVQTKPDYLALSPNGQALATLDLMADGSSVLKLVSTENQQETVVGQLGADQLKFVKLGWSNNSRYLAYLTREAGMDGNKINVYDTSAKSLKRYTVPNWQPTDSIASVHVADDAQTAAVVKVSKRQVSVQFGGWNGTEWSAGYEHLVSPDTSVEWIHNDQIAFLGTEGTLYAYDRRNAALSVLLEQASQFRLSPDRKAVVFMQDKETLYVASLYGNNVLDKTQVFRGLLPTNMEWSPDGRKLLLAGWKLYEKENSRPTEAAPVGMQNLVIEFK